MKRTTRKTIGLIPYSLVLRPSNPAEKNSKKKIYPIPQRGETVTLAQLAYHIKEHGSLFTEGTIIGILTDMVDCIKEQILLGNFVNLDGLMRIFYTFRAQGVDNAASFDSSMIEKVNLRADIDDEFEEMLNQKAKFEYVASRREQAAAKKSEKDAINAELAGGSGDSGGGDVTGGDDQTE